MLKTDILEKVLMHENMKTVPIGYQKLVIDAVEEVLSEENDNGIPIFDGETTNSE